jgi:hypothetical protein
MVPCRRTEWRQAAKEFSFPAHSIATSTPTVVRSRIRAGTSSVMGSNSSTHIPQDSMNFLRPGFGSIRTTTKTAVYRGDHLRDRRGYSPRSRRRRHCFEAWAAVGKLARFLFRFCQLVQLCATTLLCPLCYVNRLLLRYPLGSREESRAHIESFRFRGSDPAAGSASDSKHGLYSCK